MFNWIKKHALLATGISLIVLSPLAVFIPGFMAWEGVLAGLVLMGASKEGRALIRKVRRVKEPVAGTRPANSIASTIHQIVKSLRHDKKPDPKSESKRGWFSRLKDKIARLPLVSKILKSGDIVLTKTDPDRDPVKIFQERQSGKPKEAEQKSIPTDLKLLSGVNAPFNDKTQDVSLESKPLNKAERKIHRDFDL
ncbi:MAG: hypothetical protein MRY79_02935 [Alphaproteobacteria bacterium]|nr:hypothetical protein [Alphaproteobacteria bacterium]